MSRHVPEYFKGLATLVAGGGISIAEWLRNGSLLLTFLGAALAVLGGFWAYRTARAKAHTAELELKIKEIELKRMGGDSGWRF